MGNSVSLSTQKTQESKLNVTDNIKFQKSKDRKTRKLSQNTEEKIHLLHRDNLLNHVDNNDNNSIDGIKKININHDNSTKFHPQTHHLNTLLKFKVYFKNIKNRLQDKKNNIIPNRHTQKKKSIETYRILLLGNGHSGKTTIIKQFKLALNEKHDFDDLEYEMAVSSIRDYCVNALYNLIEKCGLSTSNKTYKNDKDIDDAIELIRHHANEASFSASIYACIRNNHGANIHINKNYVESFQQEMLSKMKKSIQLIWGLECVKNFYNFNNNQMSVCHNLITIDNIEYFYEESKLKEIFNIHYKPSKEDLLNLRLPTSGIIPSNFHIQHDFHDYNLVVYDTGGEHNERPKWVNVFHQANAVIFVSALSHFSQVLREDARMPSLIDSIKLFEEIINGKWFKNTSFILLLNKKDLFRKLLKQGLTLNLCFKKNLQNDNKNDDNSNQTNIIYGDYEWNGPNYVFDNNKTQDENDKYFEACYNEALTFIKNIFLSKNTTNNTVYTHITCAIDSNEIQTLFEENFQLIMDINNTNKFSLL